MFPPTFRMYRFLCRGGYQPPANVVMPCKVGRADTIRPYMITNRMTKIIRKKRKEFYHG